METLTVEIKSYFTKRPRLLWPAVLFVFCSLLAIAIGIGYAAALRVPVEYRQEMDSRTSQRIRSSVRKNKSLSPFARGVEVVSQGGKVTLRGLVQSESERNIVEAEAVAIVGDNNVSNQLEVALAR